MIPTVLNSHRFFCLFLLSLFFLYLLSITAGITGNDFIAALRSFHSMVNHATAMVGYTYACVDTTSEYDTVCSIMEALVDPDPDEFVVIFRDLFWENKMVGGRRLGILSPIGKAFKCAGTAVGSGLLCASPVVHGVAFRTTNICEDMVDNTKDNC